MTLPPSAIRINLNNALKKQFQRLKPGMVLDVGAKNSPYKNNIPSTKYMTLDIDKRNKPDICSNLTDIKWKSNYFDTVVATEVLEHINLPQKAVDEIHRILKPNGVCILSTRFMHPYHPDPKDYYRFTEDSLKILFKNFRKLEIHPHGSRIQLMWQMMTGWKLGRILSFLNPIIGRIDFNDKNYPCGFVVYARK